MAGAGTVDDIAPTIVSTMVSATRLPCGTPRMLMRSEGVANPVTFGAVDGWDEVLLIHTVSAVQTPATRIPAFCQRGNTLHESQSNHSLEPMDAASGDASELARDIAEVPAVELVTTTAVHLMSAAAVHLGLGDEDEPQAPDLDEARKLICALAGLITASLPYLGNHHARPLRDGLRSLQLAFREASPYPDEPGKGPGEDLTGPVF